MSPDKLKRIKTAQKRQSVVDPDCEKLSPVEYINWHPVGGISWEERARLMEAAGVIEHERAHALA